MTQATSSRPGPKMVEPGGTTLTIHLYPSQLAKLDRWAVAHRLRGRSAAVQDLIDSAADSQVQKETAS